MRSCWVGIQGVLEGAAIAIAGTRSLVVVPKEHLEVEQRTGGCRWENRSVR